MLLIPIKLPICYAFLLKGERPVLVDTGRPRDCAAIEKAMAQHDVAPADLSLILHTHGHWDHAGSTAELRSRTAARIAVHVADAPMMRQGDNGILRPTCLTARVCKPILNWPYPGVEPDLLIDREIDLAEFGVSARVVLTPGHTAGSLSVITDDGDALVGDLFMGGYLGGTLGPRWPSLHYFADDLEEVRASIGKLLGLSPRRFYPAHGGPLESVDVAHWLESR